MMVDVVFPDLGRSVSLPASTKFRAAHGTGSQRQEFEISRLEAAEVCSGSVRLADGARLHAVEVIPTRLPYNPSQLDERILRHVIDLTGSHHCYRSIWEGLSEDLQQRAPDLRRLDYGRVGTIQAPQLKVIRAYIEDNDPGLKVSEQKIADTLSMFGVRIPRRRRRAGSGRTSRRTAP